MKLVHSIAGWTMFTEHHLQRALQGIGVNLPDDLFGALTISYTGIERHYHNADHIADCLTHFQSVRGLAEQPDEVEVAIWFHDAVYVSRRQDNEERSAAWARSVLEAQHADEVVVQRIEHLILATKTHAGLTSIDQQLLVDVDLRILGESPQRFDAYDRAIRAEYAWVPEPDYRQGRAAVLQSFLDREAIIRRRCFESSTNKPRERIFGERFSPCDSRASPVVNRLGGRYLEAWCLDQYPRTKEFDNDSAHPPHVPGRLVACSRRGGFGVSAIAQNVAFDR